RTAGGRFGVLCVGREHTEALLPLDRLLAIPSPAHVELALELVDPLLRSAVGSVRCAWRNIEKERPVRRNGFDPAHPSDCVVGNIHCEMVVRVSRGRDQVPVLVKDRIPVIHVATIETIEVFEAETVCPPVELTGGACLPNH